MNIIPERLTAFRVYEGGSNDLKGVADIQLPSFEPLTDTVKGAGIAGEIESPTLGHFGSMKLILNWRTITDSQIKLLAQKALRFDCRGVFQDYDAGNGEYKTRAVRVVVQGVTTKVDPGKYETGSPSNGSNELEVFYIKIIVDGNTLVEVDKFNYKCVINGVDYLSDVRKALGL